MEQDKKWRKALPILGGEEQSFHKKSKPAGVHLSQKLWIFR
jgi:hypothetical protein